MQFISSSSLSVVVLLAIFLQTDAGVLGGLKALKDGLPMLASAGLLGSLKLAMLAKAGLALGGLGTALGAAALAKSKKESGEKIIHYTYESSGYGHGHGHGHGHGGYHRRRRDVLASELAGLDSEEAFGMIKKSDPRRCAEKLVCELAFKESTRPNQLATDEDEILSVMRMDSYKNNKKSEAHNDLEIAAKFGRSEMNCSQIYSTCHFEAGKMMNLIRTTSRTLLSNPNINLKQFFES